MGKYFVKRSKFEWKNEKKYMKSLTPYKSHKLICGPQRIKYPGTCGGAFDS